jgi:hypothetical protein
VELHRLRGVLEHERIQTCRFEITPVGEEYLLLVISTAHGGSDEVMFATMRAISGLETIAPVSEIEGIGRADWDFFKR